MKVYVYGDGGLWRMNQKALTAILNGTTTYWLDLDGVRQLRSVEQNWKTLTWKNLPASLYADDQGRLCTLENDVYVFNYYKDSDFEVLIRVLTKGY